MLPQTHSIPTTSSQNVYQRHQVEYIDTMPDAEEEEEVVICDFGEEEEEEEVIIFGDDDNIIDDDHNNQEIDDSTEMESKPEPTPYHIQNNIQLQQNNHLNNHNLHNHNKLHMKHNLNATDRVRRSLHHHHQQMKKKHAGSRNGASSNSLNDEHSGSGGSSNGGSGHSSNSRNGSNSNGSGHGSNGSGSGSGNKSNGSKSSSGNGSGDKSSSGNGIRSSSGNGSGNHSGHKSTTSSTLHSSHTFYSSSNNLGVNQDKLLTSYISPSSISAAPSTTTSATNSKRNMQSKFFMNHPLHLNNKKNTNINNEDNGDAHNSIYYGWSAGDINKIGEDDGEECDDEDDEQDAADDDTETDTEDRDENDMDNIREPHINGIDPVSHTDDDDSSDDGKDTEAEFEHALSQCRTEQDLIDYYLRDRSFVPIYHPKCRDKQFKRNKHEKSNTYTPSKKIRFLSWNILADGVKYALSKRHGYTPQEYREWGYRSMRIKATITAYDPDIICLQETSKKMYVSFVTTQFGKSKGYTSIHAELASDTAQSDTIIFKKARFQCIQHDIINIGSLPAHSSIIGPAPNAFRKFLRQTTDHAIICLLSDNYNNNIEFIVVSSHFYWDPKRPHVKSAQTFLLNQYLINLLCYNSEWKLKGLAPNIYSNGTEQEIMDAIPIIFACDSNSVPCKVSVFGPKLFTKSGSNQLMHHNQLKKHHLDHPLTQSTLSNLRDSYVDTTQPQRHYPHRNNHRFSNNHRFKPAFNPQRFNNHRFNNNNHRHHDMNQHQHHHQQQVPQHVLMASMTDWRISSDIKWKSVYNEYGKQQMGHKINRIESELLLDGQGGIYEPIFTNKVPQFTETIDYIWYNQTIRILSVLQLPYEKQKDFQDIADDEYQDKKTYFRVKRDELTRFRNGVISRFEYLIGLKSRKEHQLLFMGYIRNYVYFKLKSHIPAEIIASFLMFYFPESVLSDIIQCHDDNLGQQAFWRMLYVLYPNFIDMHNIENDDKLYALLYNAYNYPNMPNCKDPSDHFPLCCDFEIVT